MVIRYCTARAYPIPPVGDGVARRRPQPPLPLTTAHSDQRVLDASRDPWLSSPPPRRNFKTQKQLFPRLHIFAPITRPTPLQNYTEYFTLYTWLLVGPPRHMRRTTRPPTTRITQTTHRMRMWPFLVQMKSPTRCTARISSTPPPTAPVFARAEPLAPDQQRRSGGCCYRLRVAPYERCRAARSSVVAAERAPLIRPLRLQPRLPPRVLLDNRPALQAHGLELGLGLLQHARFEVRVLLCGKVGRGGGVKPGTVFGNVSRGRSHSAR